MAVSRWFWSYRTCQTRLLGDTRQFNVVLHTTPPTNQPASPGGVPHCSPTCTGYRARYGAHAQHFGMQHASLPSTASQGRLSEVLVSGQRSRSTSTGLPPHHDMHDKSPRGLPFRPIVHAAGSKHTRDSASFEGDEGNLPSGSQSLFSQRARRPRTRIERENARGALYLSHARHEITPHCSPAAWLGCHNNEAGTNTSTMIVVQEATLLPIAH